MIVVADAGPILHLYWIDGSSWALPPQDIFVVDEVWVEIEKFAPAALEDPRLLRAAAPASSSVDAKRLHLDPAKLRRSPSQWSGLEASYSPTTKPPAAPALNSR